MWPGRTPISPSCVGMTTVSIVSEYSRASGVTISRVRGMMVFLALLLGRADHFVDAALHVEIALGHVVELAVEDHLEAADGFLDGHVFARRAGEDLGDGERLREEALD